MDGERQRKEERRRNGKGPGGRFWLRLRTVRELPAGREPSPNSRQRRKSAWLDGSSICVKRPGASLSGQPLSAKRPLSLDSVFRMLLDT